MDARSAIYINSIIGKKYKTAEIEEKINTVKAVVSSDWSQEDILDVLEQTNFDTQKAVQEIFDGNVKPNSNPFHVIGKKQSKTQDDKQNGKEYKSHKHPKGQGQGGQKYNKDKPSGKGQRAPKTKFEKKKDKGNSGQAPAVNGTANGNTESEIAQTQTTENKVVVEDKKIEEQQPTIINVSAETTPVVAPTPQPAVPSPVPSTTTPTTTAPTTTTPTTHTSKPPRNHPRNQWKVKNSGAQSQEQISTQQEAVQTPTESTTGASVVLPPSAKHALQESAPIRFGGASQTASRATAPVKSEPQHTEPVVAQTSVAKTDAVVQSTAQQQTQQTPFANQGQVPFMNFGYPFFQNPYQMNPSANVSTSTSTPGPVPFPFAPHSYFDMAYMWEMMNQYYQQQSQQPTTGSTTPSTSTATQAQSHFPFFPPGPAPMMNPMMGAFPAYYSYADQHGNAQPTNGTQATSTTPATTSTASTSSTSAQPSSTNAFPQHFQGSATTGNSRYPNYPTADFSQSQMDQQSFAQPSYLGYEYNYYNNNQQQKNYNPQNRFP